MCLLGRSHPIFGDCQSNSHSNTFNRTSLSACTVRDTKTRGGVNLFLRPPQSSAAPRWTACPVPPLESIVLPSRVCWNISHGGGRHEWFKRGSNMAAVALSAIPVLQRSGVHGWRAKKALKEVVVRFYIFNYSMRRICKPDGPYSICGPCSWVSKHVLPFYTLRTALIVCALS